MVTFKWVCTDLRFQVFHASNVYIQKYYFSFIGNDEKADGKYLNEGLGTRAGE